MRRLKGGGGEHKIPPMPIPRPENRSKKTGRGVWESNSDQCFWVSMIAVLKGGEEKGEDQGKKRGTETQPRARSKVKKKKNMECD